MGFIWTAKITHLLVGETDILDLHLTFTFSYLAIV